MLILDSDLASNAVLTGSWTPGLSDTGTPVSKGQGYSTQYGSYMKVGGVVFIHGELALTSLGTLLGSAGARIVGLPFTAASTDSPGGVSITYGETLGLPNASESITGDIITGGTYINIMRWGATVGAVGISITEYSATGLVRFHGQYEV